MSGETITARDGDQSLRVTVEETYARGQYPAGHAGVPVGTCPSCGDRLVRTRGTVSCGNCPVQYSLPSQSTVIDETCEDCSLPLFRVERGAAFEVCLDPDCESLDEHVREAFDRQWDCPACGGDLRVLRRGGLLLGCEAYPDCETGFTFPAGTHVDSCPCGLPVFETASGRRCLDADCRHTAETHP